MTERVRGDVSAVSLHIHECRRHAYVHDARQRGNESPRGYDDFVPWTDPERVQGEIEGESTVGWRIRVRTPTPRRKFLLTLPVLVARIYSSRGSIASHQ